MGASHEHTLGVAAIAFYVGALPAIGIFALMAAAWIERFRRSRPAPAGPRTVRGAIAARFAISPD